MEKFAAALEEGDEEAEAAQRRPESAVRSERPEAPNETPKNETFMACVSDCVCDLRPRHRA